MWLLIFPHVDDGQKVRAAVQQLGNGLCRGGFADATGADQQKHAAGPIRAAEAQRCSAQALIQLGDCLGLAVQSLCQLSGKAGNLVTAAALQAFQRNTGPAADDLGDGAAVYLGAD